MSSHKKQQIIKNIMNSGGDVLIYFDPSITGVVVPAHLKLLTETCLTFGYDMEPTIYDLRVTDDHIGGTLMFKGTEFYCEVPWHAVHKVKDVRRGEIVWYDSGDEALEFVEDQAASPGTRLWN